MNKQFVREGALMDIASYPTWTRELVEACSDSKQHVVQHELFKAMRDASLDAAAARQFLIGVWPVIDQFPQYMAINLLKIRYGEHPGQEMARRYLVRNIRVEQNHADHWLAWAKASGISRAELIEGKVPVGIVSLSHWCWHTCERESLAVAMAATNYAIEGATGEWASLVCSRDNYEHSFAPLSRKKAMKWLRLHAHYDDKHPWEALEIIVTLLGLDPAAREVDKLRRTICTSHDYMRMTLDHSLFAGTAARVDPPALQAA
ncbi:iron-containing redox enzyme family protein [Crenobacter sp. SG2305]|uniref:TenA family transcriptional regulator n=1 Tax=Crenobacter oryzisoli TaxID=3056844 RepID=UPI0025AAA06A|nr:iron-containing redox enzyme family protein [Crenobacter sp. SG2305]MDN0084695.1 iron-containing redox enzyme family protein [Crenobacter sp. SG2305]